MSVDLAIPLRDALVACTDVVWELEAYGSSYPIFTRIPVPDDAPYPMVTVSSGMSFGEADGVNYQAPVLVRDIITYGRNDTTAEYRKVEKIAFAIQQLFHRDWRSLTVSGWKVVDVVASGPSPAPVEQNERTVARLVELTIRLVKHN